jgi:hypothetical protein
MDPHWGRVDGIGNGASIENSGKAVQLTSRHHDWLSFTEPGVYRSPNLRYGVTCRSGGGTVGVIVRQKFEQIEGRPRVARVLGHECRESGAPPLGRLGTGHRTPAMPLQLADDLAPREPSALIATTVLSLIVQGALLARTNQIAGTGAHQKLSHSPG